MAAIHEIISIFNCGIWKSDHYIVPPSDEEIVLHWSPVNPNLVFQTLSPKHFLIVKDSDTIVYTETSEGGSTTETTLKRDEINHWNLVGNGENGEIKRMYVWFEDECINLENGVSQD